jgi:hypothetical protein
LSQLADDTSLGNVADGINRADHRLFANDYIIKQTLELRRLSYSPSVGQVWR